VQSLGVSFIDDIIWVKPEGAAAGRNRQFASNHAPLVYKANPVTEYIMVYRKPDGNLLDYQLKEAHREGKVLPSLVETPPVSSTNLWSIMPCSDREHPAVFPRELAEEVIRLYSFVGELVLDPFAGTGTTAWAATRLGRYFVLVEQDDNYVEVIKRRAQEAMGKDAGIIETTNTEPIDVSSLLL
jgi:DNA modification methylase